MLNNYLKAEWISICIIGHDRYSADTETLEFIKINDTISVGGLGPVLLKEIYYSGIRIREWINNYTHVNN